MRPLSTTYTRPLFESWFFHKFKSEMKKDLLEKIQDGYLLEIFGKDAPVNSRWKWKRKGK